MNYYVKPTSDIFIKYLLGTEGNADLLLSFINAVLEDSNFKQIKTVELKNPFNIKNFVLDKESILDVKATDEDDRLYDIEIQTAGNKNYIGRSIYYWAKNYSAQLYESEQYNELLPVICINVLDFALIEGTDKLHTCFMAIEKDNKDLCLTDHFQIHFLELPKFNEKVKELKDLLKSWVYFLTKEGEVKEEEMQYILHNNSILEKAHKEYKKFTQNDELREAYEARRKWQLDYNSNIDFARNEGKLEGKLEGEQIGLLKGKLEDAKLMKKNGIDIKLISEISGLSAGEIEKL